MILFCGVVVFVAVVVFKFPSTPKPRRYAKATDCGESPVVNLHKVTAGLSPGDTDCLKWLFWRPNLSFSNQSAKNEVLNI